MKRMIKYHNQFSSDGAQFSTCGTKYEVLPGLYPDTAGVDELRTRAKELGLKTRGVAKTERERGYGSREIEVTEALILTGKVKLPGFRDEEASQFLGFVRLLENDTLPALESIGNDTPESALYDAINGSNAYQLGIDDAGESVDGEYWLIMSGWHFYHHIPLLGYSMERFLKLEKVDDTYFHDSVYRCSQCNSYDSESNGYTYNYRIVDCEVVGVSCGCFHEYAKDHLDSYVNDSSKAVEADVTTDLEKEGRLEFVERFVGGMTDSWRHHSYAGQSVRIGDPESILKDLLESDPDGEYVFSHDESGQFQTYFSVWKVIPEKPKTRKRRGTLKAVKGA